MSRRGDKPDQQRILEGLKDFQRETVEYVFKRLYKDEDKVNRFLIADEVGLGKTLVARGVIVKAIEELWEQVGRIDIIYICSNADIARQNINRLNITGEKDFSFASRMTMLPVHLNKFRENKINFISFSPGTSFDLRSKGGIVDERVVLYHMLKNGFNFGEKPALKNIFQGYVENKDRWRNQLGGFYKENQIDPEIQSAFIQAMQNNKIIMNDLDELLERFANYKKKKNIPEKDREKQFDFIGTLRRLLAEICIKKLEPDVIIMDEFQRFKNLLDGEDEIANLAKQLFDYKNKEVDAKIILLSATPYKMYTMYHESEDAHYEDFFRTLRFLNE